MRAQLKRLRRLAVLSSRHASQGLVEYGLILASVAFVAMIGFNALGTAQAAYWGATAPQFAAPTPAAVDFIHLTSTTLSCDHPALLAGNTTQCTVTVTDMADAQSGSRRNAPAGNVTLQIDSGSSAGPCSLAPLTSSGNPPIASQCVINWQPAAIDLAPWTASSGNSAPPPRHVTASFTPTSNHRSSTSNTLTIQVQPALTVSIDPGTGCQAPWNPGSRSGPAWNVEMGHPIICTVTVHDALAPGHPPVQGLTMPWSNDAASGVPLFNCFTNNSYTVLGSCAPPSPAYTCTTLPSGACSVIFRENPANVGDAMAIPTALPPINLTTRVYPTDIPTDNAATAQVKITAPKNDHPAGVIVNCQPVSGSVTIGGPVAMPVPGRTGGRFVQTLSGVQVRGGPATVACTIVVFDASATADFDYSPPPCNQSITNPDTSVTGDGCNPDDEDSYPPYGMVNLGPQSCNLNLGAPPALLPPPRFSGEPQYASSCTVPLNIPAGAPGSSVQYPLQYLGEAGHAGPAFPHTDANVSPFDNLTVTYQ